MEPRPSIFPDSGARSPRTIPGALRDQLRLVLLIGILVTAAGALLPWLRTWKPHEGWVDISGLERAGDAALILQVAAVAFALTWSDRAWASRATLVVAGPVLLGTISLAILRVAAGDAYIYIQSLHLYGGHGSIQPGFWVTLAGAGIITAAGAVRLYRGRAGLSFDPGVTRGGVVGAAGGLLGTVAGFVAGVSIAEAVTASALRVVSTSLVVILAITLAVAGALVGSRVAAGILRAMRR